MLWIAVLHEMNQELEHPRFHRDGLGTTPKLAQLRVKHMIAE
jgi:hypothetical protein